MRVLVDASRARPPPPLFLVQHFRWILFCLYLLILVDMHAHINSNSPIAANRSLLHECIMESSLFP